MAVDQLSKKCADGTQLGQSASDLVGFYGATPIAQRTNANQAAITDNSGGTASATTGVSANAQKQTVILPLQLADIATGTFKVAIPFAFTVTAALFRTAKPASTASKLATLTVQVNGSAVTGGVMNLTTANQNTIGGTVAASAITGANTGTAGQTLEVAASSVTAFVEGDGWVEFTVTDNDAANQAVTMAAFCNEVRTSLVNLGLIKGS